MSEDADLIEALKQVIDPELMINIVDLGLIYEVEQEEEQLDDVEKAEIRLVMTPPWTPERMTEDARDQLGIF